MISRREALFAAAGSGVVHALDNREPVPRFRARSLTGESFTNDSVKGKVTLVQFWTTWCQYCRRDQSAVDSLIEGFGGEKLLVLSVNVGEAKAKVKQFLASHPRSCPVVLLQDTNLAALFEAKSFPWYVAFDRDVKIAGVQKGAGGEGSLRRLLRKAGLDSREDQITDGELESSPRWS